MKHCLVLAPLLLSSATAFTAVHQQFHSFVTSSSLQETNGFDYHGTSDRIEEAYKAWCRVYNKATDSTRLEIFAYHFLLAEKFFGQTGAPIKLNEFADLTSAEYLAMQETGNLPEIEQPTEVIVSETKASDYTVPEPIAPANYGPSAASYLDALSSASQATNTLSGAGMTSYLDSVSSTSTSTTLGGAGMTSYLDSVSNAAPLSNDYPAASTTQAAATPFATGPAPAPYVPPPAAPAHPYVPVESNTPAASTGNYMDNLSAASSSSTPKGAGITSYLDSVATNGEVRGAGMTSYLDSVASSTYSPFEAPPAPVAAVPPAPVVETPEPIIVPPTPAQPYIPAESNPVAANGGNYMDNLSSSTTTTSGAGMANYLDTVPTNGARQGGSGMSSYLENMGSPADFATVESPPEPIIPQPYVPPEPVQEPIAPPQPVQEAIAPTAPSYIAPRPSRNIPGAHWMDTVTPISSYGSHGVNGNWDDGTYQAANERFKRRQAARRYQQAQANAYNANGVSPGQQVIQQGNTAPPAQQAAPTQDASIAPLAERIQRRQQRQVETFGGGFIIS